MFILFASTAEESRGAHGAGETLQIDSEGRWEEMAARDSGPKGDPALPAPDGVDNTKAGICTVCMDYIYIDVDSVVSSNLCVYKVYDDIFYYRVLKEAFQDMYPGTGDSQTVNITQTSGSRPGQWGLSTRRRRRTW